MSGRQKHAQLPRPIASTTLTLTLTGELACNGVTPYLDQHSDLPVVSHCFDVNPSTKSKFKNTSVMILPVVKTQAEAELKHFEMLLLSH